MDFQKNKLPSFGCLKIGRGRTDFRSKLYQTLLNRYQSDVQFSLLYDASRLTGDFLKTKRLPIVRNFVLKKLLLSVDVS